MQRIKSELSNVDVMVLTPEYASGTEWSSQLRVALESSSAVVVLLSPQAVENRWVNFEIGAAEALGKPLIPVVIEGDYFIMPDILKDRRWLDARNKSPTEVASGIAVAL